MFEPCLHLVVHFVSGLSTVRPKLKVVCFSLSVLSECVLILKWIPDIHIDLALGSSKDHLKFDPLPIHVRDKGFRGGGIVTLEFSILKVKHDGGCSWAGLNSFSTLHLEKRKRCENTSRDLHLGLKFSSVSLCKTIGVLKCKLCSRIHTLCTWWMR